MFSLITTLHKPADQVRLNEYLTCVKRNLSNPVIMEVVLVIDGEFDKNILPKHEKIHIIDYTVTNNRPTFKDMVYYSEQITSHDNKPRKWILSNADIYFPEWNSHKLAELLSIDYSKNFISLTRYNKFNDYTQTQKNTYSGYKFKYDSVEYITMHGDELEGVSTDSWFFSTPLNFPVYTDYVAGNYGTVYTDDSKGYENYVNDKCNLDIEMGRPGCDQMVNYELSKIRNMLNPCLNVVSIHEHSGWSESGSTYTNIKHRGKKYTREEYHNMMMWERQFRWKSVSYT